MKKIIALLMACVLLLCLTACGRVAYPSGTTSAFSDEATTEQAPTDATEPLPTESSVHSISSSELIAYIKDFGSKNGSNPDFVSEIKREPGETSGETKITFTYYNGLVSASVREINGCVQTIMTMSLPSAYTAVYPSNTELENIHLAYIADLQLIMASDPYKDMVWHIEQMKNAPNEGTSSTIGTYMGNGWKYTTILSDVHVTCMALRYCNRCKTNAPNVSFSSDADICDTCNGGQSGSQPVSGNNNPSGGNNPAGGNNAPSGSSQPVGGSNAPSGSSQPAGGNDYPQRPSTCTHNYAEATCTKPKTCTLCGATTGSVIEHDWQFTTCTQNKACTVCGNEIINSAPGHRWSRASCTEPERCTVCNEVGAAALGHYMNFTKCGRNGCDYVDYSSIAGTYSNTGGYGVPVGTTTMVDIAVSNVSVTSSGEMHFTYNGTDYTVKVVQNNRGHSDMAQFDCYMNGEFLEGVTFRVGSALYDNRIYLDMFVADGCELYIMATW